MTNLNTSLFKKMIINKADKPITSFKQIKDMIAAEVKPNIRGQLFELFTHAFLITDPSFQVDQIYRIEDTPAHLLKRLGLKKASDNGIDKVILDKNDRILAVQDKFRSMSTESVTWGDLATFFGDSVKADFRVVITTADYIDRFDKAPEHGRLQKICSAHLNVLSEDRIQEILEWLNNQEIKTLRKKEKPHQNRAVKAVVREFKAHERALFISACGTGKTLTSERIMERIVGSNGGDVIVFLPSLNLVRQTIRSWSNELRTHKNYRFMAVCSDGTVVNNIVNNQDDDADIDFDEIGIPVSTNFNDLKKFLNKKRQKNELRITYTTYQSSKVVAEAIKGMNFTFDFGSFDEAHRTVTAGSEDYIYNKSAFSHGLFNKNIPIAKRLFMTATAKKRVMKAFSPNHESFSFISMDDVGKYGRVAHRYTFREAADDGVICPSKIIISVINPKEISEFRINRVSIDNVEIPFEEAARQLAVKKAIEVTNAKRVITYHSRLSDAEYFSLALKNVLPHWTTGFISSKQSVSVRDRITQIVRDNDEALVTNVRCLAEGADFPAVDMVAIMGEINSKTEIIQIVGRALRKPDFGTKEIGYVMLPLVISTSNNLYEDDIAKLGFETIWNVVGALMDDDEELFTTIEDMSVANASGDKILRGTIGRKLSKYMEIVGIDSDVLYDSIQTQITERLQSSFSIGFGHLTHYVATNGTTTMPSLYRTEDGFPLSAWLRNRKMEWKNGKLPVERMLQLESLGVVALTRLEQSNLGLQRLREYINETGSTNIPHNLVYKDFPLKKWVMTRKREAQNKKGNKKIINAILKMGVSFADEKITIFEQGKRHVKEFVQVNGHSNIAQTYVTEDGFKLGQWLKNLRFKWKNKELNRSQIAFLSHYKLGKSQQDNQFDTFCQLMRQYKKEFGNKTVVDSLEYEGKKLGYWLRDNKRKWREGKLADNRIKMLEELGVTSGSARKVKKKKKLSKKIVKKSENTEIRV